VTAGVGDDTEAKCPKCGVGWHIVVAKVGDRIASVECRTCGKQRRLEAPPPAGSRLVDTAETKRHAREYREASDGASLQIAKLPQAGKQLDALHDEICEDVTAELGPAARKRKRWSVWRAPGVLVFVLQIDDTVMLWRAPWADTKLPDFGPSALEWLTKKSLG
jgi:Zn ribbon nucleic-acid-binding protein